MQDWFMPKRKKTPKLKRRPTRKRPTEDFNQAAFRIVNESTREKGEHKA